MCLNSEHSVTLIHMFRTMGQVQSHTVYSKEQERLYREVSDGIAANPLTCEREQRAHEWVNLLSKLPKLLVQDEARTQTVYAALSKCKNAKEVVYRIRLNVYHDPIMVLPNLYHLQMEKEGESPQGQLVAFLLLYGEALLRYKKEKLVFSEDMCSTILSRSMANSFDPESVMFLFNRPPQSEAEYRTTLGVYIKVHTSQPHSDHQKFQRGEHVTYRIKEGSQQTH